MNSNANGSAVVLGPEEGESLWQPLPSRGYVTNKLNPYTSPYDQFSTGIQVLEPGAHIRRHGHERSPQILFCYRGIGYAEIQDKKHDVREETIMLIGRGLLHMVVNTGSEQMRLLWFISPPAWRTDFGRSGGRVSLETHCRMRSTDQQMLKKFSNSSAL